MWTLHRRFFYNFRNTKPYYKTRHLVPKVEEPLEKRLFSSEKAPVRITIHERGSVCPPFVMQKEL
jgi:hypothetical protein